MPFWIYPAIQAGLALASYLSASNKKPRQIYDIPEGIGQMMAEQAIRNKSREALAKYGSGDPRHVFWTLPELRANYATADAMGAANPTGLAIDPKYTGTPERALGAELARNAKVGNIFKGWDWKNWAYLNKIAQGQNTDQFMQNREGILLNAKLGQQQDQAAIDQQKSAALMSLGQAAAGLAGGAWGSGGGGSAGSTSTGTMAGFSPSGGVSPPPGGYTYQWKFTPSGGVAPSPSAYNPWARMWGR